MLGVTRCGYSSDRNTGDLLELCCVTRRALVPRPKLLSNPRTPGYEGSYYSIRRRYNSVLHLLSRPTAELSALSRVATVTSCDNGREPEPIVPKTGLVPDPSNLTDVRKARSLRRFEVVFCSVTVSRMDIFEPVLSIKAPRVLRYSRS